MSMEHKAFPVDYQGFTETLAPILYQALATGDIDPLVDFIEENRERLTDPYEGAPLDGNWRDLVETIDAHQLGDFALTMFYSTRENVGLGYQWQAVLEQLEQHLGDEAEAIVLGQPFGPPENPFDPGKMGSYFRSRQTTEQQGTTLARLPSQDDSEALRLASRMLMRAQETRRGLYVTF